MNNPKNKANKRLKFSSKLLIFLFSACIMINLLAWNSPQFVDWYIIHVFPLFNNIFGHISSIFPFSVGEVLIISGLLFLPVSLILFALLLIKRKSRRRKTAKIFGLAYLWIICYIAITETFGAFVLYHGSSFASKNGISENKHTTAELVSLTDMLIERSNELSLKTARTSGGEFVLSCNPSEIAGEFMRKLGEDYPQFSGYYVTPKSVKNSYFMSRQYLMGIYFPFTAEANINSEMYALNIPQTVCHELAHTKGVILEDEANFAAYLACINSQNSDFEYSAYVHALKFALSQVEKNCSSDTYNLLISKVGDFVKTDIGANSGYWQSVQEDNSGLIKSETVAKVSDAAMTASLKLNGVEDGKKSYGRMIDLLLNYYYEN